MKKIGYIANGINIDHIPHGNAWYVVKILNLSNSKNQTGIGLNLPSNKLGIKDLIKIENIVLAPEKLDAIGLFCVGATLSIIENFKVVKKTIIKMPDSDIDDVIVCPNKRCVSHLHKSKFSTLVNHLQEHCVKCIYCEQTFLLKDIKEYKI